MNSLPAETLGRACRVFFRLAYPGGPDAIPASKRCYLSIPDDALVTDYFPPADKAVGIANEVKEADGAVHAMELRLGSAHFPHLKLRVEKMAHRHVARWVFMVDTHDKFPRLDLGAEEEAWRQLQQANRELKVRIETALEEAGLMTPNKLLRDDLE